jgi:hypothetical protein
MRYLRPIALVTFTFALAGCINSGTLLKVKPDGSGTIEQTLLMNMSLLKGMLASAGASGQAKPSSPFSEEQLKQSAARLGKGVRYVSSTPMAQGGFEGAKAIYAFDDIRQISIEQDPNVGGSSGQALPMQPKTSNPVRFALARQGESSVLTVTFDEKAVSGNVAPTTPAAPENVDAATLQMMKSIFQGFKIAIDLEVVGKIVKTNADYVSGSRITLLEIDMASLLEDEAKLRALQPKVASGGVSIAELKPLLKDVKGVKINHAVVTVEYR